MQRRQQLGLRTLLVGVIVVVGLIAVMKFAGRTKIPTAPSWTVAQASAANGPEVLDAYGCNSCHLIPGVTNEQGQVGPSLVDFGSRSYIAGKLTNTPENLIRWLRYPQEVEPGTAMPNLGVTESAARDMAAYLYTLRR